MQIGLSVIIPCYNEEARIHDFERSWQDFLSREESRLKSEFGLLELVFIDDGSSDKTRSMLEDLKRTIGLKTPINVIGLGCNRGKGAAVREGFKTANGEWVLMTDLDLSCPLVELFNLKNSNADFVVASRALKESNIVFKQKGARPSLGRLFNRLLRLMTGIPIFDTQCGFKLVRGSFARTVAMKMTENRFAFDVELLLLLNQAGATIEEKGVEWSHRETSRVSVWCDGLQMVWRVFVMALRYPRWRKGS